MSEIKKFGRYEIKRVLGSGAMGVVYEGIDTRLNRRVAIKTIHKNALINPEQAADYSGRFMREAQSVAKLNHSNIVTVYDFGEEGDIAYFVMEFIEGDELKSFFDSEAVFPLSKALGLIIDLLDALGYAHSQGIIHRDIKPANIMLDKAGRLKLTDFGVARVLDNTEGTQAGTMVGTPGYMSPEQIEGKAISPRADIFAVGVILYQFLTRQKPFTGTTAFDIQRKIISDYPIKPSSVNPDLPPFLDQVVNKALAKDPMQRYASASEFSDDLKQVLAMKALQKVTEPSSQDIEKTLVGFATKKVETIADSAIINNDADVVVDLSIKASADTSADKSNPALSALLEVTKPPFAGNTDSGSTPIDLRGKTIICSVLFLDIVGYSKVPGLEQITLKKNFNDMLSAPIQGMPLESMIILDTGDGAALTFLSDVEAPLNISIQLHNALLKDGAQMKPPLHVRMGINLGPGHLVKDINGRLNIVGDAINVAQRVMGFAGIDQILVSRSYFDTVSHLSPEYKEMFKHFGSHADKHVREHEVYEVIFPTETAADTEQALPEISPADQEKTLTPGFLPDDAGLASQADSKPGWISSLFKSIWGGCTNFFKKLFGFLMFLFKTTLKILRLVIVVGIIVTLIILGNKYMPSAGVFERYLGNLWTSASNQVNKGLQATGLDPSAVQDTNTVQDAVQDAKVEPHANQKPPLKEQPKKY